MKFRWPSVALSVLTVPLILGLADRYVFHAARVAEPVRFFLPGLSDEIEDGIGLIVNNLDELTEIDARVKGTSCWQIRWFWFAKCMVRVPAAALPDLKSLTVTMGDDDFHFTGEQIRSWDRIAVEHLAGGEVVASTDVVLVVPDVFGHAPTLPWVPASIMNWPGDLRYVREVGQTALIPLLMMWCLIFWQGQKQSAAGENWSRQVLGLESSASFSVVPGATHTRDRLWNWACFLFLLATLGFLELRQPYYFTQFDTLADILPQIMVGCRSYWQGEFPHYNPYLFLGSPLADLGICSLTYPPLFLSYALARLVLGQEYATAEVFAFLHLVAGYFATRALGRKLGLSALCANLTALSFVLSGASLIMGQCWLMFIPLVVWLPLLFMGLVRLQQAPVGWAWFLGMGLATGLPFHIGFPQLAIYLCGFFCLAVVFLVLTGAMCWGRAVMVVPALMLGGAIAAPLVYQQWLASHGMIRGKLVGNDWGIARGLPASLLPYPLAEAQIPAGWGNVGIHYQGHFYFFGGLLAFVFLAQLAGLLVFPPRRQQWDAQVWLFCALVAIWLALGKVGGLWAVFEHVPVLGFINRHPMRLMTFVVFFVCFAAALSLNRMLSLTHRRHAELMMGLMALALLGVHAVQCRGPFFHFSFQPYTDLPEPWRKLFWKNGQSTGRVQSWVPADSPYLDYGPLAMYNLPAVYNIPVVQGVNPLLQSRPPNSYVKGNLETLRTYGVRWHLSYVPDQVPPLSSPYGGSWTAQAMTVHERFVRKIDSSSLPVVDRTLENVIITELNDVDPLAFCSADRTRSLDLRMHGQGVDVDVSGLDAKQKVVVNFLHYPDMRAYVDGQPVPCLPDRHHRIQVVLSVTGQTLAVRYSPSWAKGLWLGLGAATLALGLGWALLRIRS